MGSCRARPGRCPGRGPPTRTRRAQPRPHDAGRIAFGAHWAASAWPAVMASSPARTPASRSEVVNGPSRPGCGGLGDPFDRQVEVVVQDHHRSMFEGQAAEAALELVPVDDRAQVAEARIGSHRQPPQVRCPAALPCGPRHSTRARGYGQTRPRSGRGRGAGEGPARALTAPAASRPRRGGGRAGACAHVEQPVRDPGQGRHTPPLSPCWARITRSVSIASSA